MDVAAAKLQQLWKSGVRFAVEPRGKRFIMKFGDYRRGGVSATARTLDEALAWVADQAGRLPAPED